MIEHLILAMMASVGPGQNDLTVQRIDDLAGFAIASPLCRTMGYRVSDSTESVLTDEAIYGIPGSAMRPEDRMRAFSASTRTHASVVSGMLGAAADAVNADQPARPDIDRMAAWADVHCTGAASDPVAGNLIVTPPGLDRSALRQRIADHYLEQLGEASWQTPTIFARGDLFMTIGACHAVLPEREIERHRERAMPGPDTRTSREREFYERQYQNGIEGADGFGFYAQQCERAIARMSAKVSALR